MDELMEWFQENNLSPEIYENENFEFLIVVQRGRVKLEVYRPNGKKFIRVGTRLMLPPDNEALYTPEKYSEFHLQLLERLPILGIDVRNLEGSKLAIYDQIYDDGFSFDRLFTTLKTVSLAGLNLQHLLFSIVGVGQTPSVSSGDEGLEPSYFA